MAKKKDKKKTKKTAAKAGKTKGKRTMPAPGKKARPKVSTKKMASVSKKAGAKRQAPNAKRPTPNAQRKTPHASRRTPSVIAFCCENSALKAAASVDPRLLAKAAIVRLPCSGSVETPVLLHRLAQGARTVLVIACPIDNCKFLNGNKRARTRVAAARKALAEAGGDPDAVQIEFLSSVDTHKLTSILKEA